MRLDLTKYQIIKYQFTQFSTFNKRLIKIFYFYFYIIFFGLLSCATSPTGRNQLILVSDSQMEQMGFSAFSEMKKQTPISYDYSVNNYVKCIVNSLVPYAKDQTGVSNWEVVVFKNNEPNAFALPGGKIGVHTGMLDVATSPAQIAAVIGHEIGHVIARHGAERISAQLATQTGLQLLDGTMEDSSTKEAIIASLGLGAQYGMILPHSRKHELEADLIGLKLMAPAGFDPRESIQLWKNMQNYSKNNPPEFLSTHPSNDSRINLLSTNMNEALTVYSSSRKNNCSF